MNAFAFVNEMAWCTVTKKVPFTLMCVLYIYIHTHTHTHTHAYTHARTRNYTGQPQRHARRGSCRHIWTKWRHPSARNISQKDKRTMTTSLRYILVCVLAAIAAVVDPFMHTWLLCTYAQPLLQRLHLLFWHTKCVPHVCIQQNHRHSD